jgi:hypothetical protein
MAFDVEGAKAAGYSDAEIAQHLASTQPQPTMAEAGARGLGLGVRDVLEGATALPGMALDAVTYPGRLLNRSLGITTTAPSDIVQAGINATNLPQPETSGEKLRSAAVQGGASAISTAGLGAVPGVASAFPAAANALMTNLPSQIVGSMTGPVAGEATRQAGGGPVAQTAATVLGGLAGAAATPVVGRAISPVRAEIPPQRAALVQTARDEGIPLSPGEETGSRVLKNMEGAFAQLPGTAGPEAERQTATQQAFNAAMLRRGGVSGNLADPDTLNHALGQVGGTIGDIASRNVLAVHPELQTTLGDIEANLQFIPHEARDALQARINDIREAMIPVTADAPGAPVAAIPGPAYRRLDTAMGNTIRQTGNTDLRAATRDLRQVLRGAMDDSISPEDADAWQTARRQYANLKVIQNAVSGAGEKAALGNIPPLAVKGALDKSLSEGGYARGAGDTNQLARIGQSLLREPADPGTAQRASMMRLLQGSAPVAGAGFGAMIGGPVGAVIGAGTPLVLPRLVQMGYYSGPGQAYLRNQLGSSLDTSRGAITAALTADLASRRNRLAPR